jgi:hypothetical protein
VWYAKFPILSNQLLGDIIFYMAFIVKNKKKMVVAFKVEGNFYSL